MVGHASSEDSVLEKSDSEISDVERAEQAELIAKGEESHTDSHGGGGGGHGVCVRCMLCMWVGVVWDLCVYRTYASVCM